MAPVLLHHAIHPAAFQAITIVPKTTGLYQDVPELLMNVLLQVTMIVLLHNVRRPEPMPIIITLTGNWPNEETTQVHRGLLLLTGREQFVRKRSSNLPYVLHKEEHRIQSLEDHSPFAEMLARLLHVLLHRKE